MSRSTISTFQLFDMYGYRKWGVNAKRKYGVYTVGPHDGYHTRAEASELLREKRAGERLPPYDPRA